MANLTKIREEIDKAYAAVNRFNTEGVLPLMDMAYPEHDGEQDAEAVADMMLLRDSLNRMARACEMGVEQLTRAIE